MMVTNLDMDCLRTFAAIIRLGSYAEAAQRVGRTPSAVSLQVKRLESQVGVALFQRQGRRMRPTAEGERLYAAAVRILDTNDAVIADFTAPRLAGEVSLGSIQDIADTLLPEVLSRFDRAYPRVRISVRVDRTRALVEAVGKGQLDLVIGVGGLSRRKDLLLHSARMLWIGSEKLRLDPEAPVPLVLFEPPCSFREAALTALNDAGREWEIVYTSPSLSGLRAAVQAGLGVTARTPLLMAPGIMALKRSADLPRLPAIDFGLYGAAKLTDAAVQLKREILEVFTKQ